MPPHVRVAHTFDQLPVAVQTFALVAQSPAPPDLSVHLPKQFAFLSSHDHTFASPGELRSTRADYGDREKKLACHDRTSREKCGRPAIGRHGSVPAADFCVRKIPERAKIIFPDKSSLPPGQKRPVDQLDVIRPSCTTSTPLAISLRAAFSGSEYGRSEPNFICPPYHAKGANKGESKRANQRTSSMSVGMSEKCQRRSQAERIDPAH